MIESKPHIVHLTPEMHNIEDTVFFPAWQDNNPVTKLIVPADVIEHWRERGLLRETSGILSRTTAFGPVWVDKHGGKFQWDIPVEVEQ